MTPIDHRMARNDALCREAWQVCPSKMVSWYFAASYAYYELDDPILSDGVFDELCRRLLEQYDTIEHPHLDMVEREALKSGTGFQLTNWPVRAIRTAQALQQ